MGTQAVCPTSTPCCLPGYHLLQPLLEALAAPQLGRFYQDAQWEGPENSPRSRANPAFPRDRKGRKCRCKCSSARCQAESGHVVEAGRPLASEEVAPGAHKLAVEGPVPKSPEQGAGRVWELCWVQGEATVS